MRTRRVFLAVLRVTVEIVQVVQMVSILLEATLLPALTQAALLLKIMIQRTLMPTRAIQTSGQETGVRTVLQLTPMGLYHIILENLATRDQQKT